MKLSPWVQILIDIWRIDGLTTIFFRANFGHRVIKGYVRVFRRATEQEVKIYKLELDMAKVEVT